MDDLSEELHALTNDQIVDYLEEIYGQTGDLSLKVVANRIRLLTKENMELKCSLAILKMRLNTQYGLKVMNGTIPEPELDENSYLYKITIKPYIDRLHMLFDTKTECRKYCEAAYAHKIPIEELIGNNREQVMRIIERRSGYAELSI